MRKLSFFLLLMAFATMSKAGVRDTVQYKLTVARIITTSQTQYVQIGFLESQRFYKLLKKSKHYSSYLYLLQWSEKNHKPVWVKRASEYSDTIVNVKKNVVKK